MSQPQITLADFLTNDELKRCIELYEQSTDNFATRVCDEIIQPNIDRINAKLGQENDPKYLAYAVEFVMTQSAEAADRQLSNPYFGHPL